MAWDPTKFGNVNTIRVPHHEPWKPDFVLYNNAKGNDQNHYGGTNMIIMNNGTVLWVPPTEFHSFCNLNKAEDIQKCELVMGSWTYDTFNLKINLREPAFAKELYYDNPAWEIVDVVTSQKDTIYPCCVESYTTIKYEFTMKRKM